MIRFRRLVVTLLVLALPVQGALASTRWMCASLAAKAEATAAASHAAHAMHDLRASDASTIDPAHTPHAHLASHAAHAQGASHDAPAPGHDQAHALAGADTGCNLCAACSVTAGAPPAPLVVAAVDVAQPPFASPPARVPDVAAGGPERPPRTA